MSVPPDHNAFVHRDPGFDLVLDVTYKNEVGAQEAALDWLAGLYDGRWKRLMNGQACESVGGGRHAAALAYAPRAAEAAGFLQHMEARLGAAAGWACKWAAGPPTASQPPPNRLPFLHRPPPAPRRRPKLPELGLFAPARTRNVLREQLASSYRHQAAVRPHRRLRPGAGRAAGAGAARPAVSGAGSAVGPCVSTND